ILGFQHACDTDCLQHARQHAALKAVIVDDENVGCAAGVVHARRLVFGQPVLANSRTVSPSTRPAAVSVVSQTPARAASSRLAAASASAPSPYMRAAPLIRCAARATASARRSRNASRS